MIYEAIDRWNDPNTYLEHHGVKGMKWGVRHDNPNYSAEQRKRDKSVYGRSGVRRINKRMNKGDSILAARSKEASRIHNARRASTYSGMVGSVAGGVGGAIAGYAISNAVLKKYGTGDPQTDMMIKGVVSAGSFSLGQALGRVGTRSATMVAGGYSPTKFRYS